MDVYCIHMAFVEYIRFQMPTQIVTGNQVVSAVCYFIEATIIAVICLWITKILRKFIKPYEWLMSGKWPNLAKKEYQYEK